jgi:hypothetical protein
MALAHAPVSSLLILGDDNNPDISSSRIDPPPSEFSTIGRTRVRVGVEIGEEEKKKGKGRQEKGTERRGEERNGPVRCRLIAAYNVGNGASVGTSFFEFLVQQDRTALQHAGSVRILTSSRRPLERLENPNRSFVSLIVPIKLIC